MADSAEQYDVAVIGAGPAGSIAAMTAQRFGVGTVLLDAGSYDDLRPGETLSPSACAVLRRLGFGRDTLDAVAMPSFGTRSIWGSDEEQSTSFIFNPLGNGLHVRREAFDRMLAEAAVRSGAELRLKTRVTTCERADNGSWTIQLAGDSTLSVRAVVVATGRRVLGLQRHGTRCIRVDRLIAVIARTELAADMDGFTSVEAVPDGWWYVAPQPGGDCIVMLMCDADICHARGYACRASFERALRSTTLTCSRLARASITGIPHVRPASSQLLRPAGSDDGWIACGDAALAVDPLSSSGLFRSFRTGEAAGFATVALLHHDRKPLQDYLRLLQSDFEKYLWERSRNYAAEPRWPLAPFWSRRQGSTHSNRG